MCLLIEESPGAARLKNCLGLINLTTPTIGLGRIAGTPKTELVHLETNQGAGAALGIAFDGNGDLLRLVFEAYRINLT